MEFNMFKQKDYFCGNFHPIPNIRFSMDFLNKNIGKNIFEF
jgi:hypothetical protein